MDLLIAVAIVGLLSAIALPTYQNSVRGAARAELKGLLMENAQFLERNYNSTVPSSYKFDNAGAALVLPYLQSPKSGTAKYTIAVVFPTTAICTLNGVSDQCFTLSATPTPAGGMSSDSCGTYTLTNAGIQGNEVSGTSLSASDISRCWQR